MKLELALPRELYLIGESVSLDIRLTNPGASVVDAPTLVGFENPQPVYQLRGPSYPNGVSFSLRDTKLVRKEEESGPVESVREPSSYQLATGEMIESGFTLNLVKPISEPGDYTVSARIEWMGWAAESEPVGFRVDDANFLEASLGVDAFSGSTRTVRAVWTAQTTSGRVLGESFLYEKRPDLGEVQLTGTRVIRSVGANASQPFCPWVNFDRTESPKFWHGWREGSILYAFSDDEEEPRTFDLGSGGAQIVRPTWMTRTGDLHVLVLAENRRRLQLIRFPFEAKRAAAVAWTVDLPESSLGIGLGIGPREHKGSNVAAYVSQSGAKLALRMIRLGEQSAEVSSPSLFDGFAVPDSEPSVSIDHDGTVHAAVLVARDPGLRTLAVSELVARVGGETGVSVSNAGESESAVVQAWTAYRVTSEGPPAMRWLFRTTAGTAGGGSQPVPVVTIDPVVALLRMSGVTYVLTLDASRGPHLVETDF